MAQALALGKHVEAIHHTLDREVELAARASELVLELDHQEGGRARHNLRAALCLFTREDAASSFLNL
eukprot:scaffold107008_cov60-Phaeocystis_antarctica.AAC.1